MPGSDSCGHVVADYTDAELQAIMATLAGIEPDRVCVAAGVVVAHTPDGPHELLVLTDNGDDTEATATMLEHAARHLRGYCWSCAWRTRKGSHGQGG